MSNSGTLFFIYLIVVRLSTIATGIAAIKYGYKLFATGVFKTDISGAATEMSGRVGEYELKFKTAAPGSVLGIFGAIIIVVSIAAAPPELTRQKKVTWENDRLSRKRTIETTEKMRGEDSELKQLLNEAAKHKEKGQIPQSIRTYQQAIRLIAGPMNDLARLYIDAGR